MAGRQSTSGNILAFHTKHWFARERAAKRIVEIAAEIRQLEAWLQPAEKRRALPKAKTDLRVVSPRRLKAGGLG
jgi:hypothetical protein